MPPLFPIDEGCSGLQQAQNLLLLNGGLFRTPRMPFVGGEGVVVQANRNLANLGVQQDRILGEPGDQALVVQKRSEALLFWKEVDRHRLVAVARDEDDRDTNKGPASSNKVGNSRRIDVDDGPGAERGPVIIIADPGRTRRKRGVDVAALHETSTTDIEAGSFIRHSYRLYGIKRLDWLA